MNCPKCQQPMISGTLQVRGTFLGFLAVGMSHQNLYFDDPSDDVELAFGVRNVKSTLVIGSRGVVRGHRCEACRLTVAEA